MPRVIRLLTQKFSVEFGEEIPDPTVEGDDHGHMAIGTYESRTNQIVVDKNLSPSRERAVFLHENLHAMLDLANIDATLSAHAGGLDEHVVGALAPVLLSWLRENPRAVVYLTER